jgi:hypothetical protein
MKTMMKITIVSKKPLIIEVLLPVSTRVGTVRRDAEEQRHVVECEWRRRRIHQQSSTGNLWTRNQQ